MKTSIALMFTIASLLAGCRVLDWIAPGGLNDVKIYNLSASREKVINVVRIFKLEHSEMCPPDTFQLKDGFNKDTEGNDITNWYKVYFYYFEKNIYVVTMISDEGNSASTIGFVSLIDGHKWDSGDKTNAARLVNKDFSKSENETVIREFEQRILNPIKEILARK